MVVVFLRADFARFDGIAKWQMTQKTHQPPGVSEYCNWNFPIQIHVVLNHGREIENGYFLSHIEVSLF